MANDWNVPSLATCQSDTTAGQTAGLFGLLFISRPMSCGYSYLPRVFVFLCFTAPVECRCGGRICSWHRNTRSAEEGPADTDTGGGTRCRRWFEEAVHDAAMSEHKACMLIFVFNAFCFQKIQLWGTGMRQGTARLQSWRRMPWTNPLLQVSWCLNFALISSLLSHCNYRHSFFFLSFLFCRSGSISAYAQWESVWFSGFIRDSRVVPVAARG